MTARGIRNNNPGNIRANPCFKWRGQIGIDNDGFCIFTAPMWGLRAMAMLIRHYRDYYNLRTVHEIIRRWDDDPMTVQNAYINDVAARMGIAVTEDIDFDTQSVALLKAMVQHEDGTDPYSDELIRKAILSSKVQ